VSFFRRTLLCAIGCAWHRPETVTHHFVSDRDDVLGDVTPHFTLRCRLTDELNERTRRISELEKRLQALTRAMETPDSMVASRPHSAGTYIAGPKGERAMATVLSPAFHPSSSDFKVCKLI